MAKKKNKGPGGPGIEYIDGQWVMKLADKVRQITYLEADGSPVLPPELPVQPAREND